MIQRGLWPAAVLCLLLAACAPAATSQSNAGPVTPAASTAPVTQTSSPPSPTPTATSSVAPPATSEATLGPREVVQAFYDWYLTDTDYNHLLARPELAPEFVEWLEAFTWEYNAIVCAQDLPDSVVADEAGVDGTSALVPTTMTFFGTPGEPRSAALTLGPEGWLITAVYCED